MACCVGIRIEDDGRWSVYASYGLSDLFNLVIRPNPVHVTREIYEAKAHRWHGRWPDLTVTAWPQPTALRDVSRSFWSSRTSARAAVWSMAVRVATTPEAYRELVTLATARRAVWSPRRAGSCW
ncbi:nucleotidyltransferase family protein [Actinospica robiniae]|uniref:nucleotidyltransferase family protein n=1 Tax=Actinospica robiniae TaxID=304901 RepID=UPI0009FCAED6